jgi:hypothetical protein
VVITRTIQKPIKDADVSEAIALKANACFGALAFCRGISGAEETNEWWLAMKFGLKELVQEARDRNIDLITVVSSVERQPVLESMRVRHALGEITDSEFGIWWRKVKSGEIEI